MELAFPCISREATNIFMEPLSYVRKEPMDLVRRLEVINKNRRQSREFLTDEPSAKSLCIFERSIAAKKLPIEYEKVVRKLIFDEVSLRNIS